MTECAKCGDCCERIGYTGDWNWLRDWVKWWDAHCEWAMHNLRDGEDGGEELDSLQWRTLTDARFIVAHWTPHPDDAGRAMPAFQCSAWSRETRLCTAHDRRPPICRDFPWYGRSEREPRFSSRCSFWADVPLDRRPGGTLRALPVLSGAS